MGKLPFDKSSLILEFIKSNPFLSSKEIHVGLKVELGYATVKRILQKLITENLIIPSFSDAELNYLGNLQKRYTENISKLTDLEYKKELERLSIDLSWKSSQIEGNTYSLLETERLLKEKETASGKTKDEAIMLLNHKEALDFIIENPMYVTPLTLHMIESSATQY